MEYFLTEKSNGNQKEILDLKDENSRLKDENSRLKDKIIRLLEKE